MRSLKHKRAFLGYRADEVESRLTELENRIKLLEAERRQEALAFGQEERRLLEAVRAVELELKDFNLMEESLRRWTNSNGTS